MEKKGYAEKLKDPQWQKKRLEILERDGWKCMACGSTEKTLHVHHIFYLPKMEPWEVPNGLLITFCESCHKQLPCYPEYKTCEDCPSYEDDCEGPGNHPKDIIGYIASLLDYIWSHQERFGGKDYSILIPNAYYMIKDK